MCTICPSYLHRAAAGVMQTSERAWILIYKLTIRLELTVPGARQADNNHGFLDGVWTPRAIPQE